MRKSLCNGFELKPYSVLLQQPDSESGSTPYDNTCWSWVLALTPTHAAHRARRRLAISRSSSVLDEGQPLTGPDADYQPDDFAVLLVTAGHVKDLYEQCIDSEAYHRELEAEALGQKEAYWLELRDGVDGRAYWCVMSNRPGHPFAIVRSEHLVYEDAEADMTVMKAAD